MSLDALFPSLLGDEWLRLPETVRRMHGDALQVHARGTADVGGSSTRAARLLRAMLGLPSPGARTSLKFSIARRAGRETWTRTFAGAPMRSVLTKAGKHLRERLGPVTFVFELRGDDGAIDWQLRAARVLGLPVPRAIFGRVTSRSGSEQGRYAFAVDVWLPVIGQLVAYRGWLEIIDG